MEFNSLIPHVFLPLAQIYIRMKNGLILGEAHGPLLTLPPGSEFPHHLLQGEDTVFRLKARHRGSRLGLELGVCILR